MELGLVYRDKEWPHGMKCAECGYLLAEGNRYSERLIGLEPVPCDEPGSCTAWPITDLVCLGCAL